MQNKEAGDIRSALFITKTLVCEQMNRVKKNNFVGPFRYVLRIAYIISAFTFRSPNNIFPNL